MSVYQEMSDLAGRTYRLLKEYATLLREIGLPIHAAELEKLGEEHLRLCLKILETTDPGID